METNRNTGTIQNIPNTTIYVRVGIVVAGIVTAIICSMALLGDVRSTASVVNTASLVNLPQFTETSKVVTADLSATIVNKAIAAAIAILND